MTEPLRRLLLEGAEPALAAALDRLHVQADVRGVEERDGACEVWLGGVLPLPQLEGVRARELPIAADLFLHTGLEQDAPILVAKDLCVRPPWVQRLPHFVGIELVLPRGGAFGSGEHASTRAALLALHRCWPRDLVDTLIDVGTGSGILALYGAARGARHLFACDIELNAARAAVELLPGLRAVCGSPRTLSLRADVVVANMTATELGDELAELARLWRGAPGLLVLGGLRGQAQVDACCAATATLGLPLQSRVAVDEFTALAFA